MFEGTILGGPALRFAYRFRSMLEERKLYMRIEMIAIPPRASGDVTIAILQETIVVCDLIASYNHRDEEIIIVSLLIHRLGKVRTIFEPSIRSQRGHIIPPLLSTFSLVYQMKKPLLVYLTLNSIEQRIPQLSSF
jgi:hypothetical protein